MRTKTMSSKARPYIVQAFVAIVVVAIGFFIASTFYGDKQTAKRGARTDSGVLVEVVGVESKPHTLTIEATGIVEAARTMNLKSEASGRITEINKAFYPGARLKKGEIVARISTDDYKLKLMQAQIAFSQSEIALVQEQAKGRAAQAELKAMQKSILNAKELTAEQESLVLRAPQLQEAMANVEKAKINLQQAQLDFDRSAVKMPYDGVLTATNVSIGDYVNGAATLATMTATDEIWVKISLQPSMLRWIGATVEDYSKLDVRVQYEIGGKTIERKARILSMLGEVESLGRMVQYILAVDDPLGDPVAYPLLVGAFVRAKISSREPLESIELPRSYVREGNLVYVADGNNQLDIRSITTPFKSNEYVYVTEGLATGDRVVTTLISSPVTGRKLRIKGESKKVEVQNSDTEFGPPPGPPD